MAKSIKPEDLGAVIGQELTVYGEETRDKVNKAGLRAIKELVRKTKDTAPFNVKAYHRHYVDLIDSKTEKSRLGDNRYIWYVKPPGYRLTHLLVHGHETKDGGRTKADPFLQNALDVVLPEYEEAVKEAIKK